MFYTLLQISGKPDPEPERESKVSAASVLSTHVYDPKGAPSNSNAWSQLATLWSPLETACFVSPSSRAPRGAGAEPGLGPQPVVLAESGVQKPVFRTRFDHAQPPDRRGFHGQSNDLESLDRSPVRQETITVAGFCEVSVCGGWILFF